MPWLLDMCGKGQECLTSFSIASVYFVIKLIWVSGHSDIAGNRIADGLARRDTIGELTTCGLLLYR